MKLTHYTDKDKDGVLALLQNRKTRRALCWSGAISIPELHSQSFLLVLHRMTGDVCGFIHVKHNTKSASAYISSIVIAEDLRGQGYGEQLLDLAKQEAIESWNVRRFFAFTVENEEADKFFESLKFQHMGTYEEHTYTDGRMRDQKLWVKKEIV
jgi:N-acetylglutamate synthase-like GNAT family acetyltransferase